MPEGNDRKPREPRRAVGRKALVVYDEGRLAAVCTITSLSRSGLALRVGSAMQLPRDLLVLDLAADVVFESEMVRRTADGYGLKIKATFARSALPPRLSFVMKIRRPDAQ